MVTLPQQAVRFRDGTQWDCVPAHLVTVMYYFIIIGSELVRNRSYLLLFIPAILSHYETIILKFCLVIRRQKAFPNFPAVKEGIPALPFTAPPPQKKKSLQLTLLFCSK
jgi:hypothetical protein